MKKVIRMPFRVIWFALKNDMYGILFSGSRSDCRNRVWNCVRGCGERDPVGSGHPGYLWNRESDLEPESVESEGRQERTYTADPKKRKELIQYILK